MTAVQPVDAPLSRERPRSLLGAQSAQRLCVDIISAEQDRLLREKRLSRRQHISGHLQAAPGALHRLEIGEDALGLDSLALIDLVQSVSRYFCLADSGAEDLLLVHRELGQWANVVVAHLDKMQDKARIGFETSGSTGAPKRAVHRFADLDLEVEEIRSRILGPPPASARILSVVPPRHIYGLLWSLLLPERAGLEVCEMHRATQDAIFREARSADIVIGTPFTWERAAGTGERLPPGVIGITSGGPSSPATWQSARHLGVHRFVEIYGSTETGGLGWRTAWDEPFKLSERVVRDGTELRRRRCGSLLPLQDHVAWQDDTHFTVMGRRDSVVQVAGTNVNTDHVRRCLLSVDGVAEAAVRLDGDRIKALIVPANAETDHETLEDALRTCAIRHLAAPARPDRYTFAEKLAVTAIGKAADW